MTPTSRPLVPNIFLQRCSSVVYEPKTPMPQTTPKTRSSQRLAAGMAQTTNPSLGNNPSACTPFSHALSPSPLPFPYPSTPTQAQIEAVEELKQYSDTDIVRWLAPLRAIEPDFHFRPNKWGFSRQRVDAVAILCDQDDETVLRWLKDARSQCLHFSSHICIRVIG